ncbi:hypothetical protein [Burkholderia ambifaria]|uniref:hypothetical protein n=1 Tax=Burkholderia ambifaria TaxID=152480 RepID=UPI0020136514|nr:hypothetical protein [Burkholderia ambifaria]
MSDMLDNDGGNPEAAPGNDAIPPNGDIRIMSHIRSSMSAGLKPAKPAKGLEPEASFVITGILVDWVSEAAGTDRAAALVR